MISETGSLLTGSIRSASLGRPRREAPLDARSPEREAFGAWGATMVINSVH